MVGICGMGGIGKTTLAKAVYNRLLKQHNVRENCSSFEKCSFLANVREVSKQHNGNGIVVLLKQLLDDVLGRDVRINNKEEGITMIRERIGGMKVLVVLDDVDHKDQLDVLVGGRSGWFSGESIIIVTSRDESIFNARQKAIYRVPELDPAQSLKLFSQHAFEQPEPKSGWRGELSKKVVSIAGGIPLCLQVFGSLFSDIESIEEWESKLEQVKRDQHKDVHVRLKISYDTLDEKTQRVFLDIACFLIGWDIWLDTGLVLKPWELKKMAWKVKKEYAMFMWEGSELDPTNAITELQRKFLISINDEHGTFEMHDQIRDMGRNIVQKQKPGTDKVEAIIFHRHDGQPIPPLNTMSFRNMDELRILDTSFIRMEGLYQDLPKSLKFLKWWQCPLKSLPNHEFKFEHCKNLSVPGQPINSSCSKSRGLRTWSVTVSFALPKDPHRGNTQIFVLSRLDRVPWSYRVTQVKGERHDNSRIIFERAESDKAHTEVEEVIRIVDVRFLTDIGAFIPRKLEDDKGKGVMVRDGKGTLTEGSRSHGKRWEGYPYRRIDVTFESESDFQAYKRMPPSPWKITANTIPVPPPLTTIPVPPPRPPLPPWPTLPN
ncbi:putative disease resistance protein [Nymphaea thermarum]|nr:putative disease resistance protein [Nymphaea thermarum]